MAAPTREQILRDIITMAAQLLAATDIPIDKYGAEVAFSVGCASTTDEEGLAEIGRIAQALGVEVTSTSGTHFYATKSFGAATYKAYYVTKQEMDDYSAFMATKAAWKAAQADDVPAPQVAAGATLPAPAVTPSVTPGEAVAGAVAGPATAPEVELGPVLDEDGDEIELVETPFRRAMRLEGVVPDFDEPDADGDLIAAEVEVGGYWCAVNGTRCDGETDPCHLCPTAAEPIPVDDTTAGA
jgi:hypothetical protein